MRFAITRFWSTPPVTGRRRRHIPSGIGRGRARPVLAPLPVIRDGFGDGVPANDPCGSRKRA